ncbi:DUF5009 domain-containing protein [Lentisphaerota bacterium ZTH]|nr:DUF5009 domain-containing protein [Lentisphaerota bacterium]WET06357.1 DUF5009 domain-containing protein [Lentisphaerota bacterium ZTH]
MNNRVVDLEQLTSPYRRIEAVDVFRGLIIVLMCLVNNPGSWSHVYQPFLEADWAGYGFPDLIFPGFIFLAGMAIPFSLDRRLAAGESRQHLFYHAIRRSLILFLIGVAIHMVPDFSVSTVRIPGVLQRIAIVYLICSCIYIMWRPGILWLMLTGAAILLTYWMLLTIVPVPGQQVPVLTPTGNLDAYISNLLLKGHLWKVTKNWDPEGLLGNFAAVATGITGICAGKLIKSSQSFQQKVMVCFTAGIILVVSGHFWGLYFPVIKKLWTSSFVLISGGWSLIVLGFLIWVYDIRGVRKPFRVLAMIGCNALLLYVVEELLGGLLSTGAGDIIYKTIYQHIITPKFGSLLFALTDVVAIVLLGVFLYRKKIFVKL